MPTIGQTLAFSLHDEMEGQPLTPKNVDLLTLHQFMGEVIDLLQGETKRAEMGQPTVVIEDGSVKLVSIVTPLLAAAFQADMQILVASADLDSISPKRAQVGAPPHWQPIPLRSIGCQCGEPLLCSGLLQTNLYTTFGVAALVFNLALLASDKPKKD